MDSNSSLSNKSLIFVLICIGLLWSTIVFSDEDKKEETIVIPIDSLSKEKKIEVFIHALKREISSYEKDYWASELGKLDDPRAIKPLFNIIKDKCQPFANVEEDLELGMTPQKDVELDTNTLAAVSKSLSMIGMKNYNIYESVIKDKNLCVRMTTVGILGNMTDAKSVDYLIEALNDDTFFIRILAIEMLKSKKDPRSVLPLIRMLTKEEQEPHQVKKRLLKELKKEARWALERINSPNAIDSLGEALHDNNPSIRRVAVELLGESNDSRVVVLLTEALKDDNEEIRRLADRALKKINKTR